MRNDYRSRANERPINCLSLLRRVETPNFYRSSPEPPEKPPHKSNTEDAGFQQRLCKLVMGAIEVGIGVKVLRRLKQLVDRHKSTHPRPHRHVGGGRLNRSRRQSPISHPRRGRPQSARGFGTASTGLLEVPRQRQLRGLGDWSTTIL